MAHVPEDLVFGRVQQRVQRDRQLAGAEVGAEVPADLAHRVDDVRAHLLREVRELLLGETVQVLRALDPLEQPFPPPGLGALLTGPRVLAVWLDLAAHEVRV